MKKLMSWTLAAFAAWQAAAATTKSVYSGYFMEDYPAATAGAGSYLDASVRNLTYKSSPKATATFTVTNTPAGWRLANWYLGKLGSWHKDYFTAQGATTASFTYTWSEQSDPTNAVAVRFVPTSVTLTLDPTGGTLEFNDPDYPNYEYLTIGTTYATLGPVLSTNVVVLPRYTGTRTGYKFKAWTNENPAVNIAGRKKFSGSNSLIEYFDLGNANTNILLAAKWTAKTSALTFDANGGSGTMSTGLVATYGLPMPTPVAIPARTGYAFAGFYDAASGGNKYYNADGTSARNWNKNRTDGTTLYAQWTLNQYSLTLKPGAHVTKVYYKVNGAESWTAITSETTLAVDYGSTWYGYAETAAGYTAYFSNPAAPYSKVKAASAETVTFGATANTYTVAFDANGGTSPSPASKSVTYGSAYGTLPATARTGHDFAGWYTATNGGTRVTADTTVATAANHTLWARWNVIVNSLTAATEGNGTVSPSGTHSYNYGTVVSLTATPGTGWLFAGWKEDGATGNPRDVTVVSNATYTAVFTQTVYTVTFRYRNGGGQMVSEPVAVGYGDSATPPSNEVVDQYPGHVFTGWNGSYSSVTDNRTVTAQYDANVYTVAFDANCENPSGTMSDQQFTCGESKALRQNKFTREGYVFGSWNLASDGSGNSYADGEEVSDLTYEDGGTVTLYAQWTPITYTIAFAGGRGAEGEMAEIPSVAYDAPVALPANAFTKSGCEFQHWALGSATYADGATVSNLTATAGATVTLLAVWDGPYWIEFDANGGEGEMEVQRFEQGEPEALSENLFGRAGYQFAGWATNEAAAAALTVSYTNCQVVTDIAEVAATNTLYAVWATNVYWVAFDANGGTGDAMPPQRFVYDQAQNLSSNTYSRGELWRLGGWSNTVDGVVYADGASVSNLCTEADATNTLVAVWVDNRTDLSKAMHCANLQWHGVVMSPLSGDNLWTAREGAGLGYNPSGSCAEQTGVAGDVLVASVAEIGTLAFWCRNSSQTEEALLYLVTDGRDDVFIDSWSLEPFATLPPDSGWQQKTVEIDESVIPDSGNLYIKFAVGRGTVQIDQMTWTPEGGDNPEPTEADRVEPSAVSISDGTMSISFTGDESFAYHLRATDSLSPTNWYDFGETNVGTGAEQAFEIPMDPAVPQRFFRIEVIRKGQ